MFKNPIVKNIFLAVVIAIFDFILLNLAFMLDFIFLGLVTGLIGFFTPVDLMTNFQWLPPVIHSLFVIIIGVISWYVFQSKLGVFYKVIYMTVPLVVVFLTIGMFLSQWVVVAYSLSILFSIGVLFYFYRTKQHWLYYYNAILIGLTMLVMVSGA